MIRTAIDRSGRPIVLSTSPGPPPFSAGDHLAANTNMWRISGDFWDEWAALYSQFTQLHLWTEHRSPGHWPDGDMLPLGRIAIRGFVGGDRQTNFLPGEQRTLMTLWSIANSPLMFGGDLPSNDAWTDSLLTNPEVIAVNQLGANSRQLFRIGEKVAWVSDAPGGGKYLALFHATPGDELDTLKASADFVSPLITRSTPGHSVPVNVDITGKDRLFLLVDDGGNNIAADWGDWVNMQLVGPGGSISLTELDWVRASSGFGTTMKDASVIGTPLNINGTVYGDGIGTHARSIIEFALPPGYTSLTGIAGIDQQGSSQLSLNPSLQFAVAATNGSPVDVSLEISVNLADLGFTGMVQVRDLWSREHMGSVVGTFSDWIGWHDAGLYLLTPDSGVTGDYNDDGFVNAADYTVWRNSVGSQINFAADGNLDSIVDIEDYYVWKLHYGESFGSAAGDTLFPAPEPASAILMLFGMLSFCSCSGRRRRSSSGRRQSKELAPSA
jgi:hypothetical protein